VIGQPFQQHEALVAHAGKKGGGGCSLAQNGISSSSEELFLRSSI
jgi:hypothetical protein